MNHSPDNNRSYRRLAGWAGTTLIVIGILGVALDAYWAPIAIQFLTGLRGAGPFVALVPFMPILLIALGGYLVFLSKGRPMRPTEGEAKNNKS